MSQANTGIQTLGGETKQSLIIVVDHRRQAVVTQLGAGYWGQPRLGAKALCGIHPPNFEDLNVGQIMVDEQSVSPMHVHLPDQLAMPLQAAETPARRPIILLADDNEDTRMAVSEFLAMKGYEVVTVADGRAALARIRETRPDLVLMDIQMPGMNGLEAMQQLRADPEFRSLIILALTAMGMPGDREMCLSAGADDQLLKPIRLRSLVETIEAWLAGRTGLGQAG